MQEVGRQLAYNAGFNFPYRLGGKAGRELRFPPYYK